MGREILNLHDIENTPEGIYRGLLTLREDFDAHTHDGADSKSFETIHVRTLIADSSVISTRSLAVIKKNYSDTTAGFWTGIDTDNVAKLFLGNSTNYVKWTGTAMQIAGNITATTGTIGGFTIGATTLSAVNCTLDSTSGVIGTNIKTGSAGTRIEMNANTMNFYPSSGGAFMTISGGNSEIDITHQGSAAAIYIDYATGARTTKLLQLDDANQTADFHSPIVLIQRTADSTSASTMLQFWQLGGSGAIIDLRQHSAATAAVMRIYQQDVSETAVFIGTNTSVTEADIGLLEVLPVTAGTVGIYIAPAANVAHMRWYAGSAPASPQDGDFWYDGSNLKFRLGAATKTLSWT